MMPTSNSKFPGRSKPLFDTSLHYYLNFDMGMQRSSNIYFARLAERIVHRLGVDWFRNEIASFGFGQKTHLELPAESGGVLPTPGQAASEWSSEIGLFQPRSHWRSGIIFRLIPFKWLALCPFWLMAGFWFNQPWFGKS